MATRIRANYLEALEAEDFDALGGEVYAKGFLRSYALYLGLDPVPLVEAYRQRYTVDPTPTTRLQTMRDSGMLVPKQPRRRGWLPIGIVCVLVVLALGVWSLLAGRGELTSPEVAAPETTLPPTTLNQAVTTVSTTTTLPQDVTVGLKLDGRSWVSVSVDGAHAFRGILGKGAERSFTGKEKVDLELGNAGGVLLTVNGTFLGRPGEVGQAFQRSFTLSELSPGGAGSTTSTIAGDGGAAGSDRHAGAQVTGSTSGYTGRTGRTSGSTRRRTVRTTPRPPRTTTRPPANPPSDDDDDGDKPKPGPTEPSTKPEQSGDDGNEQSGGQDDG